MPISRRLLSRAVLHAILVLGAVWALFPLVWMVLTSLKGYAEASAAESLLPKDWLFSKYIQAWQTVGAFSSDDLKDLFPSFIDHYPQAGNQVYSLAFMRSLEVMYYNAEMLKAAGFDQPPATWDNFLKVCAAVNSLHVDQR